MTTVEVNQDSDVILVNEADAASVVAALDSEVKVVQTSDQGPPGPQGIQGGIGETGPQGIPGNTVLYGPIDPEPATGVDGNFYINTTSHFMFGPKVAGIWPAGTSLIGPQGIQGIQGIQGVPGAAGVGAVHYDTAQSLTIAEREQARKNIYAAPFDALAYNGLQVNGGFEIAQEYVGGVVSFTNATRWPLDHWGVGVSHATCTLACSQAAPAGLGNGLRSLSMQATAPFSSPAVTHYAVISNVMEGYRHAKLQYGAAGAQPLTVAFWIYATIAGTFTLAVRNAAANRCYLKDIVINAAATWELKTFTIPGDVTGTWDTTNGLGQNFSFCFGAGSNWHGTNNVWQAGSFLATAATTNFFATTNNIVAISLFGSYPGNEAPPQERMPFLIRPFHDELRLCQRYWEKSYDYGTALGAVTFNGCQASYAVVSGTTLNAQSMQVEKRAAPTIVPYSTSTGASGVAYHNGVGDITPTIDAIGTKGFRIYYAVAGVANLYYHYTANARL